jgi:periplasmic divalent cation tolerance protein
VEAEELAKKLVEERLAACVNIISGVRSIYSWNGKIENDQESTLIIKVSSDKVHALGERIVALHSYDTVEVISLPVISEESNPDYLAWVQTVCGAQII